MKIGFDISQAGGEPGCGFYAEALARQLVAQYPEDRFLLYRTFGDAYWNPAWDECVLRLEADNCEYPLEFEPCQDSQTYWGGHEIDETRCGSPDIIHANNFCCPRVRQARIVYTVYDLSFLDLPDCTTAANHYCCFNGMFDASLRADMAVAISHYTRRRFLDLFPHFPAERCVVAHLGNRLDTNGPQERPACIPSHSDFFLTVGTLEPRKNLRRLLKAYQAYVADGVATTSLVLAGANGWLEDNLEAYIDSLGLRGRVRIAGFVSDAELRWLYQHCQAFVYPSLYEGFGLPVLEAMSFGAAVITSNSSSLPEVGGEAVLYVDPLQEESIANALRQVSHADCRHRLQELSLRQSRLFSWASAADAVRKAYDTALALPKRMVVL